MSTPTPPKKLLDQVRDLIRLKHYSIHTEEAYTDWIKRYILFHGKRHPQEMSRPGAALWTVNRGRQASAGPSPRSVWLKKFSPVEKKAEHYKGSK